MQNHSTATAADSPTARWRLFPCHFIRDGKCSCGNADCESPGKHPLPKDGLHAATTDANQIEKWWRINPKANIAVATGEASGIIVVDFDKRHGGFETLLEIEEKYGQFPETVEVRTGGGGTHLYYRYPAGEKIGSRNGWMQGVDIKATGGYVLMPPSNHVEGKYTWAEFSSPPEIELAEVPNWLLPLLPRQGEEKPANEQPHAGDNADDGKTFTLDGYNDLLRRASSYVAKAAAANEGNRNDAAFRLAGHVAAFGLKESDVFTLMAGWNLRNNPPLADEELRMAVASGMTNGTPRDKKESDAGFASVPPSQPCLPLSFAALRATYPQLNPPVIDGLIREGETCNVISGSKAGKSWLGYGMALSTLSGKPWLDCFATSPGKVLLIDNELHGCTLANRIPSVADAMGVPPSEYEDGLHVLSLRGNLRSLSELAGGFFTTVSPGSYRLIVLDALYRFNISGVSENDNAAMASMYNTLDRIAEQTKSAVVVIHHTSKGDQGGKKVTDVGAGAGAQSRAADCHLILREHEEDGVAVLDAAVRSFAPIDPLAIRWQFPIWTPAGDIDPSRIKGRLSKSEERQTDKDREGMEATIKALMEGPATARALRSRTGYRKDRQENLINLLMSRGEIASKEITKRGNVCHEYYLPN